MKSRDGINFTEREGDTGKRDIKRETGSRRFS